MLLRNAGSDLSRSGLRRECGLVARLLVQVFLVPVNVHNE